jgi:hypothetical protein
MSEIGARHDALFIIASVLPTPSITAARTINKGVFIATSLLRVPRTFRIILVAMNPWCV